MEPMNRQDMENIKKMNMFFGTNHAPQLYDLQHPGDLAHALLYTVAAVIDYNSYWMNLENLLEHFDESVEYYDTVTWINMSQTKSCRDSLVLTANNKLHEASEVFSDLTRRAEQNCAFILKTILGSPREMQQKVLGHHYNIREDELDDRIDMLFDQINEIDHQYSMEENRDSFLAFLHSMWT